MKLDAPACYRALAARDRRFDGLFFVGVSTTGIYCRPICPARTPGLSRCSFFAGAAEAERGGFRACFRCRPELAPGLSSVDSVGRLARAAARRIDAGFLNERSIDELAASLGVTARHLRRSLEAELGVSPVEYAQSRRLALAKQLLQDTALPLGEVALAAGFSSVRRFNALFRERFGRPPSALRRAHGGDDAGGAIRLRLDHRPPLAWGALLGFLGARAIPGVELVEHGRYLRTVVLGERRGFVEVEQDPALPALRARVSLSLAPVLMEVVARLRALFDLDARPDVIAAQLRRDSRLAPLVAACEGLRVPGSFDGGELAVRAVLGQQVSVRGATTLAGRFAERFGSPLAGAPPGLSRLFPGARRISGLTLAQVRGVGLPEARARTIIELSRALASGRIVLEAGAPAEATIAALQQLPGIGPWTAHYLAMRGLRWPDAFPAGDLGLQKALGVKSAAAAEARLEAARPFRAYAALQLWRTLS